MSHYLKKFNMKKKLKAAKDSCYCCLQTWFHTCMIHLLQFPQMIQAAVNNFCREIWFFILCAFLTNANLPFIVMSSDILHFLQGFIIPYIFEIVEYYDQFLENDIIFQQNDDSYTMQLLLRNFWYQNFPKHWFGASLNGSKGRQIWGN